MSAVRRSYCDADLETHENGASQSLHVEKVSPVAAIQCER